MANKKKSTAPSPIRKFISFSAPEENNSILSLPISESENIDIEVKPLLSVGEMASFVDGVTNALFLDDIYSPSLYELIYAKAIIAYYTNLGDSVSNEELLFLVFDSNIIEEIELKINNRQRVSIITAIQKNIEYKKQEILNMQSSRLENAIGQIETLTNVVSKYAEQFGKVDIKKATDAAIKIANIPERDLVDNILSVKFNDDTDGKNSEQIEGQKSFYVNKDVADEP